MNTDKTNINELIDRYCHNMDRQNALNAALFDVEAKEVWIARLRDRAAALQEIMSENEEIIAALDQILRDDLTENELALLYEQARRMYFEDHDDYEVMLPILYRLLDAYENTEEYDIRSFLYKSIFFEETEIRSRSLGELQLSEEWLKKIFALQDHYTVLCDEARRALWASYYNYIVVYMDTEDFDINLSYERYREMMELWHSDAVQELDGQNEQILALIEKTNNDWMSAESYIDDASEEVRQFLIDLSERYFREEQSKHTKITEFSEGVYALYLRCRVETGEKTFSEIVDELYDYYLQALAEYEHRDSLTIDEQHLLSNAPECLSRWVKKLGDKDKETRIMRSLVETTRRTLFTDFKEFSSQYVNNVLFRWCLAVMEYLPDRAEKEEWISRLIVRRQLPTYLHSVMVSRLAEAFARSAEKNLPGYFDRLPEELKGDIPGYLRSCGLFHDVGKLRIADIINTQGRSLNDDEFLAIRQHPENGRLLLEKDSDLQRFRDVAYGHHRYYDGSGGYPADYDPTVSDYRSAVNIITVCDCIDAATDHLGRNYKRAKSLDQVCEELREGAGTKYDPAIVRLIDDDPDLMEHLLFLVGVGREDTMYDAYQESRTSDPV